MMVLGLSGGSGEGIAPVPAAFTVTTGNPSVAAACSHLSLIAQAVCVAGSANPLKINVPAGSAACPDSGAGTACGLSAARNPDAGTASTPSGATACGQSGAPPSQAACTETAISSGIARPTNVQLSVDAWTAVPGQNVTLTATTDASVTGTDMAIEIFDLSTGRLVGACAQGSQCMVSYAAHSGKHSFAAFVVSPTTKIPAATSVLRSNSVDASWIAVTMTADRRVVGPGRPLTITATATVPVDKTGWLLQIYDAATRTRVTYCAGGNTCSATLTEPTSGGRALVAVLAPPSATAPPASLVVAQTDVFSVSWLSVSLNAVTNSKQAGGVVHLVALVNADLTGSGWSVGIFDNHGRLVAPPCATGSSCATDFTIADAMPSFSAAVGSAVTAPDVKLGQALQKTAANIKLTDVQASSPLVTPTVHTNRILWGVDSCKSFTQDGGASSGLYPQVAAQLGAPDFWGRYLTNTVCPGISSAEAAAAHAKQMGILPIYNDYNCSNVSGYDTGRQYGAAAVAAARAIGIPQGVALAIDIEPPGDACPGAANVDGAFIQGWYDGVMALGYVPAYYGNGGQGSAFANAYCAAVTSRPEVANNSHLWTFEPSLWGGYSKTNPPNWGLAYNTQCPEHGTAWQYMLSAGSTPDVDHDLLTSDFPLWYP